MSELGAVTDSLYTPILKGKAGELEALKKTKEAVKKKIQPLLEIPAISPKYIEGEEEPIPSKSIQDHIDDCGLKFAAALDGYTSVFIDGFYVEDEDTLQSGKEPVEAIFDILNSHKISFIPVIGLDRVLEYTRAVKDAIAHAARGCCLRILESDLEQGTKLVGVIGSLLTELSVRPPDVDLLMDFGPNVPSKAALPYQLNALPDVHKWRSLTLSSSSFPVDMSGVAQDSIEELERKEWTAWTFLRANRESVTRMPRYADYAINHPDLLDIDPRLMRMSPNIRYTSTLNYVVAKGAAYPRKKDKAKHKGKGAADQYPKLAQMIMDHDAWAGESFSWGDGFIASCARKACVGNSTNWRSVGTCHHIASVVHQISSLHGPE